MVNISVDYFFHLSCPSILQRAAFLTLFLVALGAANSRKYDAAGCFKSFSVFVGQDSTALYNLP